MIAWIRFLLTAVLLIAALCCFASAVSGVWRFGFVLNRIHAAGIGDSLGLLLMAAALIVGNGLNMTSLKLMLLVVFLWLTSPVSSHFLSQIEFYTNPELYDHVSWDDSLQPPAEKKDGEPPGKGRRQNTHKRKRR